MKANFLMSELDRIVLELWLHVILFEIIVGLFSVCPGILNLAALLGYP